MARGDAADEPNIERTSLRVAVVVPVFNERDTVAPLVDRILKNTSADRCAVILVDDGSTDGSAQACDDVARAHPEVDVIHFAQNMGKTQALAAGFARAHGDVVITIDADLQDDPAEIPRFLAALEGGLDMVCGWKRRRQDPWTRRWASRVYNGATARLFGLKLHDINCGFKAMRLEVARAAVLKHDYHRLLPAVAAAQGFRVGEIAVRHHSRRHGASKFGFERYWRGFRDASRLWWEIRSGKITKTTRTPAAGKSDRP
jgi:glycosyltransferase involved in cell wall biosynthesis